MIIPKLHYISQGNTQEEHLANIQNACTSGIELVRLGLQNASENEMSQLAQEAIKITSHFQTRLIICDDYKLAKEIKADGVHLNNQPLSPTLIRAKLYPWQIIGATANTLQDCEAVLAAEVDYISLGPYKADKATTENKSCVLGLNGYTLITEALNTKTHILAFGEITTNEVSDLLKAGVSGIVLSSEITRDFNAIRSYNELLNASVTEEQRHTFE
ncbi:thiamine phosphate synthase [Leeuwenhoekiella sp. A16]|uniref:thiamine phosphate synthase n=1 Tax=unclassified Leeuwenhoekiella TaxID=2615029 RepID=UPI003A807693